MNQADPVSKVISLYLPERGEVEACAVHETGLRQKPVTVGSMAREFIQRGIAEYWKTHERQPAAASTPSKPARRKRVKRST